MGEKVMKSLEENYFKIPCEKYIKSKISANYIVSL